MAPSAGPDDIWAIRNMALNWVHSSLPVGDLGRAVRFFRAAFDAELLFDAKLHDQIERMTGAKGMRCDLSVLRLPDVDHMIELIEFKPGASAGHAETRSGYPHIAFTTDEFDSEIARLGNLGALPMGETVRFAAGRAVYLREPGGTIVEVAENPLT